MKAKTVTDLIQIDPSLTTPVYKQIVQSISRNIDNGILNKDDMLPSVNQISAEFSLARGSVFTAYNELRSSGIIDSIPGKGYFVLSTETRQKKKIFLLFSTFTPYKETLYNALLNNLPETCSLDIYFHHHSIRMFETLIREQGAYYNTFVIMPEVNDNTLGILSKLDLKHTFLLDVGLKEYRENYPGVYQNFEKDIFSILMDSEQLVKKYKRLFLLFPDGLRTRDIISGFQKPDSGEMWVHGQPYQPRSVDDARARGIETVFVTGLATDFCVAWTAMDARKLGFTTYVIEDATRAIDLNGSLAAAWKQMATAGVQRIQSKTSKAPEVSSRRRRGASRPRSWPMCRALLLEAAAAHLHKDIVVTPTRTTF